MNDTSSQPPSPGSMEEGVNVMLSDAWQRIRERHEKCENRIRESPMKAMLGAAAAGYFLHLMPVRAILATQVRVIAAVAPSALLLFGAARICDFLQRQKLAKRK